MFVGNMMIRTQIHTVERTFQIRIRLNCIKRYFSSPSLQRLSENTENMYSLVATLNISVQLILRFMGNTIDTLII